MNDPDSLLVFRSYVGLPIQLFGCVRQVDRWEAMRSMWKNARDTSVGAEKGE